MDKKPTTCSRCSRAAGLTLIEVVAAIAILGSVLVGIVLARSRHTRQIATAEQMIEAARATDQMIADWWTSEAGVPIGQSGIVPDAPELAWSVRLVANAEIASLGARVARVEIDESGSMPVGSAPFRGPLITVDLVVPDPAVEERRREDLERLQGRAKGEPQ